MATRISLSVRKDVPQATNIARFALDAAKIRGLVQYENGVVAVTFEARNGDIIQTAVNEDFDTIMDAIEMVDYENAVKLGLVEAAD